MDFPQCPHCLPGRLIPLSGEDVVALLWACTNDACGYTIIRFRDIPHYTQHPKGS